MNEITVAIDARLAGRTNTGDSVHWLGVIHGLAQLELPIRFLLFLNKEVWPNVPLPANFRVVSLPSVHDRWWSLVQFPLAARRLGAHVLHTQYNLSPLARGGITTIHDLSFFRGPEWFRPRDRALLQRFVPASARRARAVVTVSESSREDCHRFIPGIENKISVIPNALPVGFQPVSREVGLRRVSTELGIRKPYLLTVGTRWPRKNMQLATEAFRLLAREDLELVVTGKPGWGELDMPPGVTATGYVPDDLMPSLYAGAVLYLAPSRCEGFGIPLLEAWASDCPVLCSSGPAFPEVAGDGAYVEDSWEAAQWAATIHKLLADSGKLQELRVRGRDRLQKFSWKDAGRILGEVYRRAAK